MNKCLRPTACVTCTSLSGEQFAALSNQGEAGFLTIFRVALAEQQLSVPAARGVLDAGELARASRYRQPQNAERFSIGRAALRLLLGRYSGQAPRQISFRPGPTNKPGVEGTGMPQFSVSYSGGYVLLALAPVAVGIDVERIRPDFEFADIIQNSFSRPEQAFIGTSPDPAAAFYQLWTRKEALVKATAQGIDDDFRHVPSLDGIHSTAGHLLAAPGSWLTRSFAVADGYAAAVSCPATLPGSALRFCRVPALTELLAR